MTFDRGGRSVGSAQKGELGRKSNDEEKPEQGT
jgi:hypothetical protein